MYCNKCGAKIECTDLFCTSCGSEQNVQAHLIAAAIDKDQLAYTTLYHQAEHSVKLTVYAIMNPDGQNCADADDVILESMLKGFSSLTQLKQPGSYLAWMQTIARNKAIDYLRKNKELTFSSLGTDDVDFEDTLVDTDENSRPDLAIDKLGKAELLKQILTALPPEQRTVLVMYYYNNMKISEMAAELGCTEATIKSRLKYGKAKVEAGVLELQSKHGIKLYGAAPMLLFWLFRDCEPSFSCGDAMLTTISQTIGMPAAAGTSAAGASAPTAATQTAISQTAKVGAKAAVHVGAKTVARAVAVKVAALVAAGGIAVGGTAYLAHDAVADLWQTITASAQGASGAASVVTEAQGASGAAKAPGTSGAASEVTEAQSALQEPAGDNAPYADILNDSTHQAAAPESEFGVLSGAPGQLMTGLCFARLVDMDADGVNELILVDGTPRSDHYMVDYTMQLWTMIDGTPTKLYEGSKLYRGGDIGMQGIALIEQDGKVYIATGEDGGGVSVTLHTLSDGKYEDALTLESDYVTATINGSTADPATVNAKLLELKQAGVFYNFTCDTPAWDFSKTVSSAAELQALVLETKKECKNNF